MSKLNSKIVVVVIFSIFCSTVGFSQAKINVPKGAVVNLIAGIKSDNYGLRRTSIYFAGEYRIDEAGKALIEAFKKEEFPANKVLIAYSLYRIGNMKNLKELNEIIKNENNMEVKTICNAVVEQFNEDNLMGLK